MLHAHATTHRERSSRACPHPTVRQAPQAGHQAQAPHAHHQGRQLRGAHGGEGEALPGVRVLAGEPRLRRPRPGGAASWSRACTCDVSVCAPTHSLTHSLLCPCRAIPCHHACVCVCVHASGSPRDDDPGLYEPGAVRRLVRRHAALLQRRRCPWPRRRRVRPGWRVVGCWQPTA